MKVIAVLLPSAACIITYFFVTEAIRYWTGAHHISRRRFRLRLAAWLLTVALCGAIFVGLFLISPTYLRHHPLSVLTLWAGCFAAAIALVVITYADVKETEAGARAREVELWKDFARSLAEKEARRRQGNGQPEGKQDA